MIQDDVKILTELIRIVNRYGPDSVSNLANRIKDPQYATELATALENAVAGASRTKVRAKSRSTNRVGIKLLNELKESDPQKQSVIAEFRDLLLSSRCLVNGRTSPIREDAQPIYRKSILPECCDCTSFGSNVRTPNSRDC